MLKVGVVPNSVREHSNYLRIGRVWPLDEKCILSLSLSLSLSPIQITALYVILIKGCLSMIDLMVELLTPGVYSRCDLCVLYLL